MPHQMPPSELQECIRECVECASVCAQTAHHCLQMGGEHAGPAHQGLLRDCEQICTAAAGFMARMSHYATALCRECAEICAACAEDCDRMAHGDEPMVRCAEACRRCVRSCERMVGTAV